MSRFGNLHAQLTLPPRYFGRVEYYAAMGACRRVIVDDTARYDKRRKDTHRMDIVDTHGIKSLTVPMSRRDNVCGPLRWSDIAISRHGQWWHVVSETLASAYGRTPFFEFYIDRFRRFFSASTPDEFTDVASLCHAADEAVRRVLGFDNEVVYASEATDSASPELPAVTLSDISTVAVEYYQVRRDKFGFIPHLSILDLIFNMGPESAIVLSRMSPAELSGIYH